MTTLVDEAVATTMNLPSWLVSRLPGERGRRYHWSPAEDAVLRACYGRTSRPEIAGRVSAVH